MTAAAGVAAGASLPPPQPDAPATAVPEMAAVHSAPAPAAASAAGTVAEPVRRAVPPPATRTGNTPPRSARTRQPGPVTPTPMRPSEPPRPKLTSSPKPVYTENRPRAPLRSEGRWDESPRVKFFSYTILAIVLAGGLLWMARPKPDKSQLQTANRTATNAAAVTPAARTQTVAPEPASPAGTPPVPGAVAGAAAVSGRPAGGEPGASWRVVVFTFARQDDASRQAQALNVKHPGFDAQVFSPDGKAPYVIVLGAPMTREEANRIRQKARASGFPRDTYVQNFSR